MSLQLADREVYTFLDRGDPTEYVNRKLFGDKVDSLEAHIDRKQALADPVRYSILYLLWEYGEISRQRLAAETGRDSNDLQYHLRDLLDANLIAQIPAPSDADGRKTYYRITTLGKQEIANDVANILDSRASEVLHNHLGDPELIEEIEDDEEDQSRRRVIAFAQADDATELNDQREDLRTARQQFQTVDSRKSNDD